MQNATQMMTVKSQQESKGGWPLSLHGQYFSSPFFWMTWHTRAINCCGTAIQNCKVMTGDFQEYGTKVEMGDTLARGRGDLTIINWIVKQAGHVHKR